MGENLEEQEQIENEEQEQNVTKITSVVLDMCQPLYNSGRVVNMDNYYTSPEVAVLLKRKGVYMRGTCRKNRRGFPKGVLYSKTDAKNFERGSYKMMVDATNLLVCYGWLDGSPVQILSTADGSVSHSSVVRRIGKEDKIVKAPLCLKRYNQLMQGVDRHDQLRATFSLVARHRFKKYYIQMMLGLMDMAITNAFIHYKLVNPDSCTKNTARYEFMNGLATALCTTNWSEFGLSTEGRTTDTVFNALCLANQGQPATTNADDIILQGDDQIENEEEEMGENYSYCLPVSYKKFIDKDRNQRNGFRCQVCLFEGRINRELRNVVICSFHALRLCTTSHDRIKLYKDDENKEEVTDYSWMAPDGLSCWQKAHDFYIPRGLFARNPTPISTESPIGEKPRFQKSKVSSEIYCKKRLAFGLDKVMRGRKKEKTETPPPGSYAEEVEETQESQFAQGDNLRQLSPPRQSRRLDQDMHLDVAQIEQI